MNCEECRAKLTKWINGAWDAPELEIPSELTSHAKVCHECGARLRAAQALVVPKTPEISIPPGLQLRVMEKVVSEPETRPTTRIPRWSTGNTRRVVWLAAAAAVLVLASSLTTIAVMRGRLGSQVEVHLVLDAPAARTVSVVGDWNDWEPESEHLEDPDGDGRWEITIRVNRDGEYRYQFVVDSEDWISDPAATLQVRDGFGGTNSVLNI